MRRHCSMWLLAAAVAAGLIGPHEPTAVAGTSPKCGFDPDLRSDLEQGPADEP